MRKTAVVYVKLLRDVACKQLLNRTMFFVVVQKTTQAHLFLRHDVETGNNHGV